MSRKVLLEVMSGPSQGKSFEMEGHDVFVFGRRSKCFGALNDAYVSRYHFLLEVNDGEAAIQDLGSLHGTYVNGHRHGGREIPDCAAEQIAKSASAVTISDGDRIQAGAIELLVRILPPSAAEETDVAEAQDEPEAPRVPDPRNERSVRSMPNALDGSDARSIARVSPESDQIDSMADMPVAVPQAGTLKVDFIPNTAQRAYPQPKMPEPDPDDDQGLGQGLFPCISPLDHPVGRRAGFRPLIRAAKRAGDYFRFGNPNRRYVVESELGRGQMGVVFLARHKKAGRQVAIKMMTTEKAVRQHERNRFLREMSVMRELRHANIVAFLEGHAEDRNFFFVIEYCNAGNLEQLAQQFGGRLPVELAVPLMRDCLLGLRHAHERRIVHRDLKPANILLSEGRPHWTAKLADFGLAKSFAHAGFSGLTLTNQYAGTPQFMPREQITDFKAEQYASDVWSLAATFYYVLAGTFPLEFSRTPSVLSVILNGRPVPIRERVSFIPTELAHVLDRALSVDVDARYQNATEMLEAFDDSVSRDFPGGEFGHVQV